MSEQGFTPGPWAVSSSFLVCTTEARIVARCQPIGLPELDIPSQSAAANAHLIAAAPDLYAALKSVLDWFDAIDREQYERTVPGQTLESAAKNWELPSDVPPLDMTPLQQAIRKAEGTS